MNWFQRGLVVIILLGTLARFYNLNSPWTRKGHYNYGGVHTSMMVQCFEKVPFHISKAIPMQECANVDSPGFYRNHPPTFILAELGWSKLFGFSEASIRSFVILFSILNIYLVYLLGLKLLTNKQLALLAATVHSILPGTLFFGSHADFVNEFAVFWCLLAALALFNQRVHWACLLTICSGLISWLGYLNFASLFVYQWYNKKRIWSVVFWGIIACAIGLAMMMWLQQTTDIIEFLKFKILKAGYVPKQTREEFYIVKWLYMAWQYQNILLSPIFLFVLVSFFAKIKQFTEWKSLLLAMLVISGPGVIDLLPGHEYFYIHEFDYMYFLPAYSIAIAYVLGKFLNQQIQLSKKSWALIVIILATYTYGRLMTNIYQDVVNSVGLIAVTIGFAVLTLQNKLTENKLLYVLSFAGMVNISQMINWRNEPTLDFDFCKRSRQEFTRTGRPVQSTEPKDFTRDYYCQGVPLRE